MYRGKYARVGITNQKMECIRYININCSVIIAPYLGLSSEPINPYSNIITKVTLQKIDILVPK